MGFLVAGQLAPQQAILNGFRLAAARLGGYHPLLVVTIGGVTRTSATRIEEATITDYEGGTPNEARVRVSGFTPTYGQEIKIGIRTVSVTRHLLFAGHIIGIDQVTEGGTSANVAYDLTCIDYTWLLNRRLVSKQYTNESATAILQDLVDTFTSGFTYVNVEAALTTIDEITFTNEDVSDAIDRVMARIGGYWYLDYSKDLHAFLTTGDSANNMTDAAPHTAKPENFKINRDLSQVRTRYFGEGLGSTAYLAAAAGDTMLALDDTTAFASSGTNLAKIGPQLITYTGKGTGYTPSYVWTQQSTGAAGTWYSVAWSPTLGLFAAVGTSGVGSDIMTSPDGITWTSRTAGIVGHDICWSEDLGLFVAVGNGDVETSTDGVVWTDGTPAEANSWRGVAWSPTLGLFAAVSLDGTNRVMVSANGTSWTAKAAASALSWRKITWADALGLFVAVAADAGATSIMTSADGDTWNTQVSPTGYLAVCWSPTLAVLVAVGLAGAVATSTNGTSWTARTAAESNSWYGVTWSDGLSAFVATAITGTNRVMTSADGVTWIPRRVPAGEYLGIAWAPEIGTHVTIDQSANAVIVSQVEYFPQLTGIPASGTGALVSAVNVGDEINLVVQRDDAGRQTALAALTGGDGIVEDWIQDRRLSETEMIARCDAALELNGDPIVTVEWLTRDRSVSAGRIIDFSLAAPTSLSETDLKIQRVTMTNLGFSETLWPWRQAVASSKRYTFEDLIRRMKAS